MKFFFLNSVDFWHRKLTLKVQFWHFLRPSRYVNLQNTAISFEYSWFLNKNLAFLDPSSEKLHDVTDINIHSKTTFHITNFTHFTPIPRLFKPSRLLSKELKVGSSCCYKALYWSKSVLLAEQINDTFFFLSVYVSSLFFMFPNTTT